MEILFLKFTQVLFQWSGIYLYVIYSVYFSEYQSVRSSLCVYVCVYVCVLALPAVFLKVVSNVRARITCMGDCS